MDGSNWKEGRERKEGEEGGTDGRKEGRKGGREGGMNEKGGTKEGD